KLAATQDLRDVPAVLGVERLADLAVLESRDGGLELGNEGAGAAPAEVASLGARAWILGGRLGQTSEILALEDALADVGELLAHGGIIRQLGGLHQDMADMDLFLDGLVLGAADLVQADDVKAGRRTQRVADFTGLEFRNHVGEEGRQLAALAPTQGTAFQCGLTLGVGQRELGKVLAS